MKILLAEFVRRDVRNNNSIIYVHIYIFHILLYYHHISIPPSVLLLYPHQIIVQQYYLILIFLFIIKECAWLYSSTIVVLVLSTFMIFYVKK